MENQNQGNHKSRPGLAARAGAFAKKGADKPADLCAACSHPVPALYFHTLRPYSETADSPHTKTLAIF